MKILILVNAAQEHRPFYGRVGRELAARGHDVHYALDSHYTDFLHRNISLDGPAHYFSDYLRDHFARREVPTELDGENLWTAALPDIDRLMYTRFSFRREPGYYESVVANLGHFFVELFDRFGFQSVVYENVSNAFSYLAYLVARGRGAKYIGFAASRMPGRLDVFDSAWARDSRLAATFAKIRSGELVVDDTAKAYVHDYVRNFDQKLPDYMTNAHPFGMTLAKRYLRKDSVLRFVRSLEYGIRASRDRYFAYQVGAPLAAFPEQLGREMWRHRKVRTLKATTYSPAPDLTKKYFVYPIQFHPESSASVDGPAFNDEWANITNISANMPFGVQLFVKDHKHAAGRQPLSFYEKITRLPNVTLVDPDFHTKTLLRHAQAVVCSTSTMGFEALVLGKPVFVLGHPFYEFHPLCTRVTSYEGMFELFSRASTMRADPLDIEALIAAYYLTSYEGSLDILRDHSDPAKHAWIASLIEERTLLELEQADHLTRRSMASA